MGEKWREVYTEEQIKKIQRIEVNSLKVLDEACNKLGICYFVYGGTLIGAVRHKGFIPWDDDLDVAMPRNDYMRFVYEAAKILPEEYYLQTPYTDKKTPFPYSKLRLKGTEYIEYINHRIDIEKGIYIDIYPIDNIPDSDSEYIKMHKEYAKIAKRYVLRQCPYPSSQGKGITRKIKNIARFVLSHIMKVIPQKYFIGKIDGIMTRYNHVQTERKGNLFYPRPANVFYNLFPLQDGVFEGMPVKLPGDWDRHLRLRYGNYMEFPPEEERIGHIPYILDFGKY